MNSRNLARATLLCTSAALFVGTASAQQTAVDASDNAQLSEPASSSDEIVVTAQKRVERLLDVPLSVTAASGEQLVKQGVTETSQLTKLVPGFTFQQGTYGTPVFAIRGIGFFDNSILAGPTVTAYLDQVPLPLSVMTRGATLDLERVEALKGPQGTLFGQNSTGGAINYIAAKPTNTLKAGADLGYGRFNEITASAFVSGPLADTLRARIAVQQERRDGWQKSLTRPGDTLGRKRFYNGRILIDWKPSDRLSFEVNVSGWQDQSDTPASQFVRFTPTLPVVAPELQFIIDALSNAPTDLSRVRSADWDPNFSFAKNDKFYLLSLRTDWEIADNINLTSITAYSHLRTDRPIDTDGVAFTNFRYDVQDGKVKTFTQELRLNGEIDRLKWMIGGNYQNLNGKEYQNLANIATNNGAPLGAPGFQNYSAYINNQYPITKSVFGGLDFDITNQLTVQGSLRYTEEKRKFNGCLADSGLAVSEVPPPGSPIRVLWAPFSQSLRALLLGINGPAPVIEPNGCITFNDMTFLPERVFRTLKEDNLSWRASLNWKPNPDTLLYVTAAKGYKAGSFSILPAIFASQFQPVTQESIMSYEAGLKLSLAERKLQLTGAAFYYDYKDKQLIGVVNTIFGHLPKLINVPKSRVWGLEIETTARPLDGLVFRGGVTYVNSRVQRDPVPPDLPLDPNGALNTYVGEAFPNTPKWQAVGDAEYTHPLGDNINGFVGGSLAYKGSAYFAFGEIAEFKMDPYTLIDLRAGIESRDGDWRLQLWAHNITNKLYVTNVSHLIDSVTRTVGMPATYGATLSFRY